MSIPHPEPSTQTPAPWHLGPALERARFLAGLGCSVIPIRAGEKKAAIKWTAYQRKAAVDAELVEWFGKAPGAPVGLITGAISGLVVVDCDSPEALEWARANLPPTPLEVLTSEKAPGFRGRHLLFRHPGKPVRNAARIKTNLGKLALDVRGDGGYILAAGSQHPSGSRYDPLGAAWTREAMEALPLFDPGWILEEEPPPPPPPSPRPEPEQTRERQGRPEAYERARKWLEKRDPAVEGQGGDLHTFSTACKLVRGFDLSDAETLELLLPWNATCCPPWSVEDLEEKIHSARQNGKEPFGAMLDVPPPVTVAARPKHDSHLRVLQGGRRGPEENNEGQGLGRQPCTMLRDAPTIRVSQDLPGMTSEALAAIYSANVPPFLFSQGTQIVRIMETDSGPALGEVVPDALRGILARVASWVVVTKKEGEKTQMPPLPVVADILALPPNDRNLPEVNRLVRVPVLSRSGRLLNNPGYHAEEGLIYHPEPGFRLESVPEQPTAEEVQSAKDLLLDDLLCDFPFADEASRAHAVASLLFQFCRALIPGCTPLTHVDAPSEGTGKGLLIQTIAAVALGNTPVSLLQPPAGKSEEWGKSITAILRQAPSMILMDNLEGKLDSPHLAACLTLTHWEGRELGRSVQAGPFANSAQWMSSGNNVGFSRELARRTVMIRLDSQTENPEERTAFRHYPLLPWVHQNRAALVKACLTLIRAWLAAGRPNWVPSKKAAVIGSFEGFCQVMGGILGVAGIPGFLENRDDTRARAGEVEGEWTRFFEAWFERFGSEPKTVNDLFPLVEVDGMLMGIVDGKDAATERGRKTKLGIALRSRLGRIHSSLRMEDAGQHRKNGKQYCLTPVGARKDPPPSEPTPTPPSGDLPFDDDPPAPPRRIHYGDTPRTAPHEGDQGGRSHNNPGGARDELPRMEEFTF